MTILPVASPNSMRERFLRLNWGIINILVALAAIGVAMHFSVSSGQWTDMPLTHGARFVFMLAIVIGGIWAWWPKEWRMRRPPWRYPRSAASASRANT
mgnify:CR=1 FL=1